MSHFIPNASKTQTLTPALSKPPSVTIRGQEIVPVEKMLSFRDGWTSGPCLVIKSHAVRFAAAPNRA